MINHKDITQGSLEWFEIKWGKIGGTLAKGLHTKGDTLFLDILSQQIEDFEPIDSFETEATQRGNEYEPFAREYISEYTGLEFEQTGWLQSKDSRLLGISPDGITEDETIACELKCLGRKKHTSILVEDEIPLDFIHQCIHYFTVNPKLKKLYFCAFRPESTKNFVKMLTLESEVNIRTKAKPQIMTIEAAKDYSIEFAKELETRIDNQINKLKF